MLRGAALIAFACLSCGASNQQGVCPLLSTTAPQGTLEVRQLNEFGSDYKVLSIRYVLDSCVLRCSDAPAFLEKETVVVEPRKVSAGLHHFRFVINLRSAFGGTHSEVIGDDVPIDVPEGGMSSITLRMFEDERAPASDRIRFILMHARNKNPPAEAPAAGSQ